MSAGLDDPKTPGEGQRRGVPIAIVAALGEELGPLRARTRARRLPLGGVRAWRGALDNIPLALAVTGDGAQRAERGLSTLLSALPEVQRLLVIGVSGGLSPDLAPCDLLVAAEVLDADDRAVPAPDSAWLRHALATGSARSGRAATRQRLLCRSAEKHAAWRALGAGRAAACDLESSVFANVAASRRIPYLVVRAVSDSASEDLPFDLNACLDASGSVERSCVLRYAITHPVVIPGLWRLRRRVGACARVLANWVEDLLAGEAARSVGSAR